MAAAAESDGWPDVYEGRNFALHGTPARRKSTRIHASDGAEIAHPEAVLLDRHAGARLLRNFRRRLVGIGTCTEGRNFRRWRQDLDGSRSHQSDSAESAHALPPAMAVARRSGPA